MPTSYDSEKMSIVMSGHETCKYGKKIERKNSWARECIFSSHRPQKSMKNKRINIKEEKFRILLENWSRYRSEEISPISDGCRFREILHTIHNISWFLYSCLHIFLSFCLFFVFYFSLVVLQNIYVTPCLLVEWTPQLLYF